MIAFGSGLTIAALLWLYLNWIVLLIGAQVAYYVQNPAYLRIGRREPRLSNSRAWKTASAIVVEATPATTGTRPLVASITTSTTRRRCGQVR